MRERSASTGAVTLMPPSWTFLELYDEEDLWWEEWDKAMYATYGHMTFPERMKAISERFIEIQKELYGKEKL